MYYIDYFLDRITMYRLVLYYLLVLLGAALVLGILGVLPYSPFALIFCTLFLVAVCWITNRIFAYVFQAPTNVESVYISALILALIITPVQSVHSLAFFGWVAVWTMAAKYIFALNKKHIFNPVAIGIVITSLGISGSASWWVGNTALMPLVLIGGLLIVRKIRRPDLVFSFLFTAAITILAFTLIKGGDLVASLSNILSHSSYFFFAFVMLTEPLTTPPVKKLQIAYGALVGFLFAPQIHIGSIYSTPELALCAGNIFSYLVSPKHKLILFLKQKLQAAPDIIDFVFATNHKLAFKPGQYMEWTLPGDGADSRGNRRYFTIASSPTEETLRLGVKFYDRGSSYKKKMALMDERIPIVAAQLAGEFTLPDDSKQKLVFIAGGIGVTPYRSMVKYLVDTKQQRDIILLYANKKLADIVYTDVFDQAEKELGIKTIYTLTDLTTVPVGWLGRVGRIDAKMIEQEISDYKERIFYLSGPQVMVDAYEKVLRDMGVKSQQIKTDFFPGLT